MRICILTHPLYTNYGGILQAYALQTVLQRIGHEAWVGNLEHKKEDILHKIQRISLLRRLFGKTKYPSPSQKYRRIISQYTNEFIRKNIVQTKPTLLRKGAFDEYDFDAYVVGSDQVWRPSYSSDFFMGYFLDFVKGKSVKRIAYAASFGVDYWEYSLEQTVSCGELIRDFDAISVREQSGVALCKTYFDVKAVQVLDPTMLLNREDYLSLIDLNVEKGKGQVKKMFVYILDWSEEKKQMIQKIMSLLDMELIELTPSLPKVNFLNVGPKKICDCIYPPVEEWIRAFEMADFVLTDSFHGTVFSMIFNRQFVVLGNKERGLTRFSSLLDTFGLSDRLVVSGSDVETIVRSDINWNKFNEKREILKSFSFDFLNENLGL